MNYRVTLKNDSQFYLKNYDGLVDCFLEQVNNGCDIIAFSDELIINIDQLVSIEKL